MQLPDPSLAANPAIGVVGWIALACVGCGLVGTLWLGKELAQAQKAEIPLLTQLVAEVKALALAVREANRDSEIIGRLERVERFAERGAIAAEAARDHGAEHVRIGRKWEQTEAPGRVVKEAPRP